MLSDKFLDRYKCRNATIYAWDEIGVKLFPDIKRDGGYSKIIEKHQLVIKKKSPCSVNVLPIRILAVREKKPYNVNTLLNLSIHPRSPYPKSRNIIALA